MRTRPFVVSVCLVLGQIQAFSFNVAPPNKNLSSLNVGSTLECLYLEHFASDCETAPECYKVAGSDPIKMNLVPIIAGWVGLR